MSQKNIPDIFDCNLKTAYQILIIFGRNIFDTTCHQMTIYFPTSPNVCFCTTWWKHSEQNITFSSNAIWLLYYGACATLTSVFFKPVSYQLQVRCCHGNRWSGTKMATSRWSWQTSVWQCQSSNRSSWFAARRLTLLRRYSLIQVCRGLGENSYDFRYSLWKSVDGENTFLKFLFHDVPCHITQQPIKTKWHAK